MFNKNIIFLSILSIMVLLCVGQNCFGWLLVIFTTYTIMANNCAQTIGMFIASNKGKNKFRIICFLSGIFITTLLVSWLFCNKRLDFYLLHDIPYNNLNILLFFIPILLFFLTKYKIPVSATFLIIPVFANRNTIHSMITKTSVSYFVSFLISLFVWEFIYTKRKYLIDVKNEKDINKIWFFLQFISTGIVWSVWLVLSSCNFVVFLPRTFELKELILIIFIGIVSICLILLDNGGKIQEIVDEKSDINIKSSVVFNFLFSFVMLFIQCVSKIPITSTWMFLGILAGRELAITASKAGIFGGSYYRKCFAKIWGDLKLAIFGVLVSLFFVGLVDTINKWLML